MTESEIEAAVEALGLRPLLPGVATRFVTYLELLLKWNAKLNLSAIREPEAILRRHFLECIFLTQQLPAEISTLLDFGSGGGFPGVPIALCRPEIQVTLAESQSKKAAFLREAVRVLGVNAEVYNGRVEALDREFNAVTLRAVDKMQEACLAAQLRVAHGGWLILFATGDSAAGLKAGLIKWKWQPPLWIPGSEQGVLLFGRRG